MGRACLDRRQLLCSGMQAVELQHANEHANEGRRSGEHLPPGTQQAGRHPPPPTVTRTSSGAVRASGSRLSGAMGSMGAGATWRGGGWGRGRDGRNVTACAAATD